MRSLGPASCTSSLLPRHQSGRCGQPSWAPRNRSRRHRPATCVGLACLLLPADTKTTTTKPQLKQTPLPASNGHPQNPPSSTRPLSRLRSQSKEGTAPHSPLPLSHSPFRCRSPNVRSSCRLRSADLHRPRRLPQRPSGTHLVHGKLGSSVVHIVDGVR